MVDPTAGGLLSRMVYTVYAIRSETTGKIYIGFTGDLKRRLKYHNGELGFKKRAYTYKNKGPWKLIYRENYKSKSEALKREKQLKSYKGREFVKIKTLGR